MYLMLAVFLLLPLLSTALAHEDAAVVRGGAMYDMWWAVTGAAAPTTNHPLWASRPDTTRNTRTGADTWRCKECHGWDYKGVNGAYASGSHRTGFAGILGTTKTAPEVFDLIKTNHGYGAAGLSDEDIRDLVTFVLEGLINTGSIIDANGVFIGNMAIGQTLYDSGIGTNLACAACHGQLGLTPPPGASVDFGDYPGLLSNENPWEFQHKVRFGQPGAAMPRSVAGGGTILDVADLGAYSQTLPKEPAPETITFDPNTPESVLSQGKVIFQGACGVCHSLPTANDMKAFPTDDALVAFEIGMAERAGLSETDAEYVIRYLLALRHDVLVAAAREFGQPRTVATLAGFLGVGACVPARRRETLTSMG
jgi:thiosulfate dehydrogenase